MILNRLEDSCFITAQDCMYCITGIFRWFFIFALFVVNFTNANLKPRKNIFLPIGFNYKLSEIAKLKHLEIVKNGQNREKLTPQKYSAIYNIRVFHLKSIHPMKNMTLMFHTGGCKFQMKLLIWVTPFDICTPSVERLKSNLPWGVYGFQM